MAVLASGNPASPGFDIFSFDIDNGIAGSPSTDFNVNLAFAYGTLASLALPTSFAALESDFVAYNDPSNLHSTSSVQNATGGGTHIVSHIPVGIDSIKNIEGTGPTDPLPCDLVASGDFICSPPSLPPIPTNAVPVFTGPISSTTPSGEQPPECCVTPPTSDDPIIATGYTLTMISGGSFGVIGLPPLDIVNNASYQITAGGTTFTAAAGSAYFLDPGTTTIEITGIDPALGLDPANTLAFPVQLAFYPDGDPIQFSMMPLRTTIGDVPEPASLALLAAGVIGFGLLRRNRRQARREAA